MTKIPVVLLLSALALGVSCTKKEEAKISTEKKKPPVRAPGGAVGRGMIVDPRKALPILKKTRAAADAMSNSGRDRQSELDSLK